MFWSFKLEGEVWKVEEFIKRTIYLWIIFKAELMLLRSGQVYRGALGAYGT